MLIQADIFKKKMELSKFIAETLKSQQALFIEQMTFTANQFKEAGKKIKKEEKEEFFELTSNKI